VLKPSTTQRSNQLLAAASNTTRPTTVRPVEGFGVQIRGQPFLEPEREAGMHGLADRFGAGMGGSRGGGHEVEKPGHTDTRQGGGAQGKGHRIPTAGHSCFGHQDWQVAAPGPHTQRWATPSTRELPASAG